MPCFRGRGNEMGDKPMDLLDRLLGHDAWTTQQLLLLCRRAQLVYMLRRLGVENRPEGDVLSWEHRAEAAAN
jgi:hypothetical protein